MAGPGLQSATEALRAACCSIIMDSKAGKFKYGLCGKPLAGVDIRVISILKLVKLKYISKL